MSDPITDLQADIAAILGAIEDLAEVSIQREDKGTIAEKIAKPLRGIAAEKGKKPGMTIVVGMPDIEIVEPGSYQPIVDVSPVVTILENPIFNRTKTGTQVTASEAAELIIAGLHARSTGVGQLISAGAEPLNDGDAVIGYECKFRVRRGLNTESRGAIPIISISSGTVTITGAGHAGEQIYYTIDGSPPAPGGQGVSLYVGAFTVQSGDTVRACTIADDYDLSDFTEETAT